MAVQARHPSHAFPHDLHAFRTMDDDADAAVPGTAFFDGYGWAAPAAGLGALTRDHGFQPRKRPRVAAGCFVEEQSVPLPPVAPQWQTPTPAPAGDVESRIAAAGAASTSGRAADGAGVSQQQGLTAWLHHHGVEVDALVRLESERMRAGLETARRRHAAAVLAAVERAASARLRAAEAELERALRRGAELEEEARRVAAECQAWMGVARGHEAVAAGLRAALDELRLQRSSAAGDDGCEDGGEAEDAQSCCGFEAAPAAGADAASKAAAAACRACGGGEASVLLLPCRHLCLCPSCEAAVDACPVCAAAKNASLRVLLC